MYVIEPQRVEVEVEGEKLHLWQMVCRPLQGPKEILRLCDPIYKSAMDARRDKVAKKWAAQITARGALAIEDLRVALRGVEEED